MDNKEFKKALNLLVKEKGIDEEVIYDAMQLALTSAYKKNYHSLSNVRIEFNKDTGSISVFLGAYLWTDLSVWRSVDSMRFSNI